MASIYKVGNKYRIEFRYQGGRYTAVFPTKRECVAWEREKIAELDKQGDASKRTLREALLEYQRTESIKKASYAKEIQLIDRFINENPELVSKRLSDVTTYDIGAWRDKRLNSKHYRTGKPISPSTVEREMNVISAIFTCIHKEWRWLNINPFTGVKWPAKTPPRERLITDREIEGMLIALGYHDGQAITIRQRVACAFLFALETGLRVQEICLIHWEDINGRVLEVNRRSKTAAGYRKVPLSKKAMEVLAQLGGGDPVFKLTPSQLSSNFRAGKKIAGLDGFTFHDARANATTSLSKKLDIYDLARVIGHKDLNMLMVYYRRGAEDMVDDLD